MNKNSWEEFLKTGKVTDYLKYKNQKTKEVEFGEINETKNSKTRDSNK